MVCEGCAEGGSLVPTAPAPLHTPLPHSDAKIIQMKPEYHC